MCCLLIKLDKTAHSDLLLIAASECLQWLHKIVQGDCGASCSRVCGCHGASMGVGVCGLGAWQVGTFIVSLPVFYSCARAHVSDPSLAPGDLQHQRNPAVSPTAQAVLQIKIHTAGVHIIPVRR